MDDGSVHLRQGPDGGAKLFTGTLRGHGLRHVLQGDIPLFRLAADVAGALKGGSDQPRLLMLRVPEYGPGGEQAQKRLLYGVLRVGGGAQAGAGQPQQHIAVGRHDPADGFIGTKWNHVPHSLHSQHGWEAGNFSFS